ncbi:Cyclin-D5-1 [Apostasia shenzhenica]|uniref:Cyclin-D5-1 n=1 Tax=Apostasia shenzhenica TaxID=1088818 RepID=A0A2I0ADK8_9ASPA|nr:Cyclin-D5-1 [Apostasia shenzhenica]
MELSDCSVSLSGLFCLEDGSLLDADDRDDEVDEELFIYRNGSLLSQPEDEHIGALVSKETSFGTSGHSLSFPGDSLRRARFESIRWILKTNSCFGFGSQTAYLAVTYFDRFFLLRTIDETKIWAMRLLSIACLSLAAKMEECSPPALPEFRQGEYQFSSRIVQRMELLVLDTLEWRLSSVTPFSYLSYFAFKFHSGCSPKNLISQAIWFIFVILEDSGMNIVDFRPSTIAAAAILAASSSDGLTKKLIESKMSTFSLPEPLEIEQVFSCYNAMILESKKEKMRSFNVTDSRTSGTSNKSEKKIANSSLK